MMEKWQAITQFSKAMLNFDSERVDIIWAMYPQWHPEFIRAIESIAETNGGLN